MTPWSWKIPHAVEQRSPSATTTEPVCYNNRSLGPKALCSTTREATAVGSPHTTTERSPCSLQLEKPCTQPRRPSAAKNKQMFKRKHFQLEKLDGAGTGAVMASLCQSAGLSLITGLFSLPNFSHCLVSSVPVCPGTRSAIFLLRVMSISFLLWDLDLPVLKSPSAERGTQASHFSLET